MKERLDKLLVERGLVESRARAQALIIAGQVLVREQRIDKPGHAVDADSEIRIKDESLKYVSRGGLKLEAALREFHIDPSAKNCIDIGASTGGFTDCLLQHGAAVVWAIDVGHNQIAWRLRQDARVEVIEGQNARYLEVDQFPVRFDLATIDVVFISLSKIFPAVASVLAQEADCIALVKPQFEVGMGEVGKKGIVTDGAKHRRVLGEVKRRAAEVGLKAMDVIGSPILGAEGNREFLIHLKLTDKAENEQVDELIETLTPI